MLMIVVIMRMLRVMAMMVILFGGNMAMRIMTVVIMRMVVRQSW